LARQPYSVTIALDQRCVNPCANTVVLWGLQEAQVLALVTGLAALGFLIWRLRGRTRDTVTAGAA
jgi:hypothetical protein